MARWRERLRYAKRVWMEHGIIGDSHPSPMRLLISLYRGDQWSHLRHITRDEEDLRVVNKVFPIARSLRGEVAARRPRVQLFAANPDAEESVVPVETLINRDLREIGWQRPMNAALLDGFFAPFGCIRHTFVPGEEFQTDEGRLLEIRRNVRPDRPSVRRWAPWNVLADPTAESFLPDGGMRWVAFRSRPFLRDLIDNPNTVNREGLEQLGGNVDEDVRETMRRVEAGEDPDANDRIELWTVYEMEERTWFQITMDGLEKPIRDQDDWPLPWRRLPVDFFIADPQIDTPMGIPILENVAKLQQEMNHLRTMMSFMVRNLRRLVFVNASALEDGEADKLESAELVEILKTKGDPNIAMRETGFGGLDQSLAIYGSIVEEDIRETIGQSKMGRGQRINVESATEAANVQHGQNINTDVVAQAYEDFNLDAVRLYVQARRATMDITGPEEIRVVGQRNADEIRQWVEIEPEDLDAGFDFEIAIGSTRRRNRAAELQQAVAMFQIAAAAPNLFNLAHYARKVVEAAGDDPVEGLSPEAIAAAERAGRDEDVQTALPERDRTQPGVDVQALVQLARENAG